MGSDGRRSPELPLTPSGRGDNSDLTVISTEDYDAVAEITAGTQTDASAQGTRWGLRVDKAVAAIQPAAHSPQSAAGSADSFVSAEQPLSPHDDDADPNFWGQPGADAIAQEDASRTEEDGEGLRLSDVGSGSGGVSPQALSLEELTALGTAGAREEVDEEVTISHGRSPRSQLAQEQHEAEEGEGEGHAEGSELSTGERLAELRARHDQLHGSANKKARHKLNLKIRALEQQLQQEQDQEQEEEQEEVRTLD